MFGKRKLLSEILRELREQSRLLSHINRSLAELVFYSAPNRVARYVISQENPMAITGIAPGSTGTFAANPLDASGNPITSPLSVVPIWSSSDPLAAVTASADGLTASVAVDATAVVGGSFSLSVSNPDGSALDTVSVPYSTSGGGVIPASFGISQTS